MSFNMKYISILILLFEIFIYIEAYRSYHPDVEMIETNGPPTYHERMLLEAAAAKGMDPEAVLKVLRTRQPVFKKENLPDGGVKTSKYYINSNGAIAVKVRIRSFKPARPVEDFKPSFRPFSTDKHHPNFFYTPIMFSQPERSGREQVTYVGPNGERGVIRIWSSEPKEISNEPDDDLNSMPEPETKPWEPTPEKEPEEEEEKEEDDFDLEDPEWKAAFGDDSLEKTTPFTPITTTPKTWSWPKVFPSKSTTTTTTVEPKMDEDFKTTTTTARSVSKDEKTTTTTTTTEKSVPNLDEFLRKQYGSKPHPNDKSKDTVTTTPVSVSTDKSSDEFITTSTTVAKPNKSTTSTTKPAKTTTTARPTTTSKTLNIDDLDPNKIFYIAGQPVQTEGSHPMNEKPHSIQHIPKKPLEDLDPETVHDFNEMGINTNSVPDGTVITKTVTGPDGNPITTKYKIQYPRSASRRSPPPNQESSPTSTTPSLPPSSSPLPLPESTSSLEELIPHRKPILLPQPPELEPLPLASTIVPPTIRTTSKPQAPGGFSPYPNTNRKPISIPKPPEQKPLSYPIIPVPTTVTNPIEAFLDKIGLTKAILWENNGRYAETFIDDEGCVLTATFVLSRPMPYYLDHYQPEPGYKPIK